MRKTLLAMIEQELRRTDVIRAIEDFAENLALNSGTAGFANKISSGPDSLAQEMHVVLRRI
jgi:hypothetical protein